MTESSPTAAPEGIISDLRVLAFARDIAGAATSMLLADYGASVVEVDTGPKQDAVDLDLAHAGWRRGKTVIRLPEDETRAALLDRLLSRADILVTDLPEAELAAMDLDFASVEARYPRIVYTAIGSYRAGDPRNDRPAVDALVAAKMGLPWAQQGFREGPKFPAFAAGSYAAVFLALSGTFAALHVREETGRGQQVDTSIYDGFLAQQGLRYQWGENLPPPSSPMKGRRLILGAYLCADDVYLYFHTGAQGAFGRLMTILGMDDRIPVIETNLKSEMGLPLSPEEEAYLHEEMPNRMYTKTRAEWVTILRENGIPCMETLAPGEALRDEHVKINELAVPVDVPGRGTIMMAGPPLKFSVAPPKVGRVQAEPIAVRDAAGIDALWPSEETPAAAVTPAAAGGASKDAPLRGIRVLDFGFYFAGPYATSQLGDLGAEVIKVEALPHDPMRPLAREFCNGNRGKRNIALDLKQPGAQEILRRLIATADIVGHNMRPGTAERLGIGYDQVKAIKADIIYSHSPAYGLKGPYVGLPGFEPLSSAFVGLLTRSGGEYNPPAQAIGSMDPGNGMLGAAGMLMALHHHDRTGEGSFIECPQLGSALLSVSETMLDENGEIVDPFILDMQQLGYNWAHRLFQAADGWLCVACRSGAERDAFHRLTTGQPLPEGEVDHHTADAWFEDRTVEAALAALEAAGVAAEAVGPAYNDEQYAFDETDNAQGRIFRYHHPVFGNSRNTGGLWRFSGAELDPERGPLAVPGENSVTILRELGFSTAEIDGLVESGAVVAADAPAATPA